MDPRIPIPDLVSKFLETLDEEIARVESEAIYLRAIRDRLGAPDVPPAPAPRSPEWSQALAAGALTPPKRRPQTAPAPATPADPSSISSPPKLRKLKRGDPGWVHPSTLRKGQPISRIAPKRTSEELLIDIRDWVVQQGDKPFSNVDLAKGITVRSGTYAGTLLQPLIDKGVVEIVKRPQGGRGKWMYRYAGKPEPPKNPPPLRVPGADSGTYANGGTNGSSKGEPVPGTGRKANELIFLPKDIADLLEKVRNQVTVQVTGSGHRKVTSKSTGQSRTIASTPSDHRNLQNVKAILREIGVNLPS